MDNKSLAELKARCFAAASNGQNIARAATYVAELQKEVGPADGYTPNSAEHLLALIEMAEQGVKAAPKTQPSPKAPEPPPAPKVEIPPPPPPPLVIEEAAPEIEVSVEDAPVEAEDAPVEAEEAPAASGGGKKKGKKGK